MPGLVIANAYEEPIADSDHHGVVVRCRYDRDVSRLALEIFGVEVRFEHSFAVAPGDADLSHSRREEALLL
jgi:hypothetical protein